MEYSDSCSDPLRNILGSCFEVYSMCQHHQAHSADKTLISTRIAATERDICCRKQKYWNLCCYDNKPLIPFSRGNHFLSGEKNTHHQTKIAYTVWGIDRSQKYRENGTISRYSCVKKRFFPLLIIMHILGYDWSIVISRVSRSWIWGYKRLVHFNVSPEFHKSLDYY